MNRVLMKDIKDMFVVRVGDEGFGIRLVLKPDARLYPKNHGTGLYVVHGDTHLINAKDWMSAQMHLDMLLEHVLFEDVFADEIQASRMAKQDQLDELETFVTDILGSYPVRKDSGLYAVKSA